MNIKTGDLIKATYKEDARVTKTDVAQTFDKHGVYGIVSYMSYSLWDMEVIEAAIPEPVVGMILKHEESGNKYLYAPRSDEDNEPWISEDFRFRFLHEGDIWPRVNLGDSLKLVIVENPAKEA